MKSYKNQEIDEENIISHLKNIIKSIEKYANGLLISDQYINDTHIFQIPLKKIHSIHGHFDFIIVNLNKSLMNMDFEDAVIQILQILSYIKVGGVILIPKGTYDYLPGRRKGVEAIIKNSNFNIEVPPVEIKNTVIATKR